MNVCETDSELNYLSSATLKLFFALKCRFQKNKSKAVYFHFTKRKTLIRLL